MSEPLWFCYSKVSPILLPVALCSEWTGYYVPLKSRKKYASLELGGRRFTTDPESPLTDWGRVIALLDWHPQVKKIVVGHGFGLVFSGDQDHVSWWQQDLMLINGGPVLKAELTKLDRVQWSDELIWQNEQSEYTLMCACEHGANVADEERFHVHLKPGNYLVKSGCYGWDNDDVSLTLYRFFPVVDSNSP